MGNVIIFLVVVGFFLYLGYALLKGIVGIFTGASGTITEMLGRANKNATAFIPAELDLNSKVLPKVDLEREGLANYKPVPWITPKPVILKFVDGGQAVFQRNPSLSNQIDIDRVSELLNIGSFRPYEPAFAILNEQHAYPIELPSRPNPIESPPVWNPWSLDIPAPSFSLPLWEGKMSIFNNFVSDTYANETAKYWTAKNRRDDLLKQIEVRNVAVSELASRARDRFNEAVTAQNAAYQEAEGAYGACVTAYDNEVQRAIADATELRNETLALGAAGLNKRIELTMRSLSLPPFISNESETRFDPDTGILIHEHQFPDLNDVEWVKHVQLKSGWTKKPANQKETKEAAASIYPALSLCLAAELARLDNNGEIKAVAINGWCEYTEKSTGQRKRAYCSSVFATKEQIDLLNLQALDPVEAFHALKGQASRTIEMAPIAPTIRLDTDDKRFVDAKEVLSKLEDGENLAAMDWEDFEHLCRELFERAFAGAGAEVKVTQASRDQGVDAIVFDPDPIRGGKIVIQAKRYTNTVDVSAVRDLFGAVMNEGAMKGILVTTSQFGPESYSFAKDKPLTLLNGRELLGLLEQHGYKFRINLAEAKAML